MAPLGTTKVMLSVPLDRYQEMVALDVSEFIQSMQGLDYLNTHHCQMLLKKHFPTFAIMFRVNPETHLPFFDIENSDRGTLVGVYIIDTETGLESETHWYPVMGREKKKVKPAAIAADARLINDQMARAMVRCVAKVTGIGANIWLRLEADEMADFAEPVKQTRASKPPVEEVYDDEEEEEEYEDLEDDDEYGEEEEEEEERPAARSNGRGSSRSPAAARRPSGKGGSNDLPRRRPNANFRRR